MRIAYLARWDVSHESGILKKMATQIRAWLRLGHEVRLFAFSPSQTVWDGLSDVPITVFHRDRLWSRLTAGSRASDPVRSWHPDVIYLRWSTYYPAWRTLAEAIPTIIELNGDDIRDNRLSLPYPLYLVHLLTRDSMLSRARGFVSVSRELARSERYTRFGAPIEVIGNGLDLASIEPLPAPTNLQPRLIYVGYANCPWHGVDKLWELARLCPDWHIDVVGFADSAAVGDPPANVQLHGHLGRGEYLPLLRQADVAVGTLALHRKDLNSTSAIKTGEYLAHGLPTIIAYEDTDFPSGHPLLLQLPNTPDNVRMNVAEIREFVTRSRGVRFPRESISHLDVMVKERERLSFLARFVET